MYPTNAGIEMHAYIWAIVRPVLFWAIVGIAVLVAWNHTPIYDEAFWSTLDEARGGTFDNISRSDFANALAGLLAAAAVGLAAAYGIVQVLPIGVALWRARRVVHAARGHGEGHGELRRAFAANFSDVRQKLERDRLIGHAWRKFEEALFDIDSDRAIRSTVRPQTFFNSSVARDRSTALKMMNAVPGYFVGIGLLLTFIGLVFALREAGTAVGASDAKEMTAAMGKLLKIATFKFSTSIAGLAASIVLSLVFRWYFIVIEKSFDRFSEALEGGLLYAAPQSISMEMNRTLADQLTQLKDITQGDFFARMGSEIERPLKMAISEAMQPVTDQIGSTVRNLGSTNEAGLKEMIEAFNRSLQVGAGTEMRELAGTLKQLQVSIAEMQGGLRGSGDDFSIKLSEAANNLSHMVERAGQAFEENSRESQGAIAKVAEDLRLTMERANSNMDRTLGSAADRAAGTLGREVNAAIGALIEPIGLISQRFLDLASSMRSIDHAMQSQKAALEAASLEARRTADAFGESATSVRAATTPLITIGDRFSGATERLATSVETTRESLSSAKEQVAMLASSLGAANDTSKDFWSRFASKFEDVDTALGKAVDVLSRSTSDQQQRLEGHVQSVDRGLALAVGKLSGALNSLADSAESIASSMEKGK